MKECLGGKASLITISVMAILIVSSAIQVRALNPGDRAAQMLWNFGTGGGITDLKANTDFTGQGHADVLFGSSDGNVYLVDGVSGAKIWSSLLASSVTSVNPIEDLTGDGRPEVLAGTDSGNYYLINGITGNIIWSGKAGAGIVLISSIGDLNKDGKRDIVIVTSTSALLVVDSLTRNVLWSWTNWCYPPGYYNCYPPSQNPIELAAVLGDTDSDGIEEVALAYLGSNWYWPQIVLISPGKGPIWSTQVGPDIGGVNCCGNHERGVLSMVAGPDISGDGVPDVVYVGMNPISYSYSVNALSGAHGNLIWSSNVTVSGSSFSSIPQQLPQLSNAVSFSPDITGDGRPDVIVGTNNDCRLIDGLTGQIVWQYPAGNVYSVASVTNDKGDGRSDVLCGGTNGGLHLVDGLTGHLLWSYDFGSQINVISGIRDTNGDGRNDVVAGTAGRFVYQMEGFAKIFDEISISASSNTISPRESITISGLMIPTVPNAVLTITYLTPNSSTINHTVTVSSDGSFRDYLAPDQIGTWQFLASWRGDSNYLAANSSRGTFRVEGYYLNIQLPPGNEVVNINGINYTIGQSGSISASYKTGSTLTILLPKLIFISSDTRLAFGQWADGSAKNPRTITLAANTTLSATYIRQYKTSIDVNEIFPGLTLSLDGNINNTNAFPQTLWLAQNSQHSLSVPMNVTTGNTRYVFEKWTDGFQSSTRNVTVSGPISLTAEYKLQFFVDVKTDPANLGTTSGGGWYDRGAVTNITAQPVFTKTSGSRYVFQGWSGIKGNSTSYTAVINGATSVVAHYRLENLLAVTTFPINLAISGGGWYASDITIAVGPAPLSVTFDGLKYTFQGWLIDGAVNLNQTVSLSTNMPHLLQAVYYQSTPLQLEVSGKSSSVSVVSNSTIVGLSQTPYGISIQVQGPGGTRGVMYVILPMVLLQSRNSTPASLMVYIDGKLASPTIRQLGNETQVGISYAHSVHGLEIYYNSFVLQVTTKSIFGLPIAGAQISASWPSGGMISTITTGPSGSAFLQLPLAPLIVSASFWPGGASEQLSPNAALGNAFLNFILPLYYDLYGAIFGPVIVAMALVLRHQSAQRKAGEVDRGITAIAEKYRRPLSASLITKELGLSLPISKKALERFVRNEQARTYTEIDGTEYVGIPSVWKDLPGIENAVLNRLLDKGGSGRRAELRVWSGLPENAFAQVMGSLERAGYLLYDQESDIFRLRGMS